MRKFIVISFLILFVFVTGLQTSVGQKQTFSIIEVITPWEEIYDSGIYRILYRPFYIVDGNGKKIISCGYLFDRAAKVKLYEGSYTIYYQDLDDNIREKDIKVEKNSCFQVLLY